MRRFSFLRSWKFWVITAVLLAGCFIDLERTKAYGWTSLKICIILAILALIGYFMTDKEKFERTVTYNRNTGRILGQTDWKSKGYSSPADRDRSNSMAGCLFAAPIFALLIGLFIASLANTGNLLLGWPAKYTRPGSPVPTAKSPDEKNRVVHPAGFSMVFPENWKIEISDDRMLAYDSGSSYNNEFIVRKIVSDDTTNLPDTFQGKPARSNFFPGNKLMKFLMQTTSFKQGDQWFLLQYNAHNYKRKRGPLKKNALPIVDEYFQTFRFLTH